MAKKQVPLNPAAGLFNQASRQEIHPAQYVHEAHEPHVVHHVQEVNQDNLKNTQGRKGHKLPRINMAFTPENHEFIKRTSRQQGISATEYVNNLIDQARHG